MWGFKKKNPDAKGLFPISFVKKVNILDNTAKKTRDMIDYMYQSQKSSWLEAKEYDTRF